MSTTTETAPATTRVQQLAAALLADQQRDRGADDAAQCFVCGRGVVYGRSRFCSDRCRDYYDARNPGYFQDWLHPKPKGWRVIAGPPGCDVGADYRPDGIIARRTKDGFIIRCAHCEQEFESRGLRCCSPKCEAELLKPQAARKHRRPKIAYYTVKVTGHGYWQPSQAIRDLGFQSVDCGYDGRDAWAKAEHLNEQARQARVGRRSGCL